MERETTAAAAVSRWPCNATPFYREFGAFLLGKSFDDKSVLTPTPRASSQRWSTSLWLTGFDCMSDALWEPPTVQEQRSAQRCAAAVLT